MAKAQDYVKASNALDKAGDELRELINECKTLLKHQCACMDAEAVQASLLSIEREQNKAMRALRDFGEKHITETSK